jgi:tRNA(Arg) A34 adenosine deaminase TadA
LPILSYNLRCSLVLNFLIDTLILNVKTLLFRVCKNTTYLLKKKNIAENLFPVKETKLIFTFLFRLKISLKMKDDLLLLQHTITLAKRNIREGGGPFGAVVALNGKIVAEAGNMVVPSHDPTAHAEVLAIRKASAALMSHDLSKCVIYASCEPCPMCLGAIYWAGIKKVVYAAGREDAATAGFSDSLIYDEIILKPSERKVTFIRVSDAGGKEVFKEWDEYEGKVQY